MVVNDYAVIKSNNIINTIIADENFTLEGFELVLLTKGFGIGDCYKDGQFVKKLYVNIEGELLANNIITVTPVLSKHDAVKLYIDDILQVEGQIGDSWQVQFESVGSYFIKVTSDNYGTWEMEVEVCE